MKTPFLGSFYVARSVNAADDRCINLFPEIIPQAGKMPAWLMRAPGLRRLAEIGDGPIRGLWMVGNIAYVASGGNLYQVDRNYTATFLGYISGTGPVSMADNGTQIFIACNPNGYIYNSLTNVFQQISDPDFPGAVQVGYLDGFFVFTEPNSQKFWITSLLDGTAIDPLDFASAEGFPDNIVSMIVDHRELWLFGTNTTEVWYDAGLADFPFTRIQGAFNEIGSAAPFAVCKADNQIYWLGADARGYGIVYRANGYIGQRVSTHAVEWQIQSYGDVSNAIMYSYQQDGHTFIMLVFPNAETSWCFDVATGAWHERAAWDTALGRFYRHRSNCQMTFGNDNVVGDFENGNLYAFDLAVYADNDEIQRWMRSWRALPTGANDLNRTAQHSLQLDCESGVGLNDGQGEDPQVMLQWSDDGGHTWSNEHWRSMGRIGNYGHRVIWRRLGMTRKLRDRVYMVAGTDPVKLALTGAELLISPTAA